MTADSRRGIQGAANLSLILILLAAALVLVFVFLLGRDGEEARPDPSVPAAKREPLVQKPTVAKRQKTPSERPAPPAAAEPESRVVAREPERYEEPKRHDEVVPYEEPESYEESVGQDEPLRVRVYTGRDDAKIDIARQVSEGLANPPGMPESLRNAIDRGEVNEIPPEYQAALDGPGPQISPELLQQLQRQATDPYIPPDVLEKFEEAGRRMNDGWR